MALGWLVAMAAVALGAGPPSAGPPLPLAPGDTVTLPACPPDPSDPCWASAPLLGRFAAAASVPADPVSLTVRLAHHAGALVMMPGDLPPGHALEVTISGSDGGRRVTADLDGPGSIRPDSPMTPGQPRRVAVHLIPTSGHGATLTWAPAGPGDLSRSLTVLPSSSVPPPRSLEARLDGGLLYLAAPGAEELTLQHLPPAVPMGDHGIPQPWRAVARADLLATAVPHSGWYQATATWVRDGGPEHVESRRIHLTAPGAPQAESLGITPMPRELRLLEAAPFRLESGARVVAGDATHVPAARLLAEEVERLAGHRLEVVTKGRPRRGDLWVGPASRLPRLAGSPRPRTSLPSEGFVLRVGEALAAVGADDARGATYGALALADALGRGGVVPALTAQDHPALAMRALYHRLDGFPTAAFDPETYRTFLRRVVARGRYNTLILAPRGRYEYERRPELAGPRPLTREQLQSIIEEARGLGLDVVPGIDTPAHAQWILGPHPELAEDGSNGILCTRHPETYAILQDVIEELIEVFQQPPYVHIGHDEVFWRTEWLTGEQRCPRCQGSPRWRLFADHLRWHVRLLEGQGARAMIWSDMLVPAWNGRYGDVHRAVELLSDEILRQVVVMSWARIGDTEGTLSQLPVSLVRGHTGYDDWKREGLSDVADDIAGEALALFLPAPWSALGEQPSRFDLRYHWPLVILAGSTAWRPDLADTATIDTTIDLLSSSPAYLPGYRALPSAGSPEPLPIPPTPHRPGATPLALPPSVKVSGVDYPLSQLSSARAGEPIRIPVGGPVAGLSFLQAVSFPPDLKRALLSDRRASRRLEGPPVVVARVVYEGGRQVEVPLHLGLHTGPMDLPPRGTPLWRSAGVARVPSADVALFDPAGGRDQGLHRLDWWNPHPHLPVTHVDFSVEREGVDFWLASALAFRPGP